MGAIVFLVVIAALLAAVLVIDAIINGSKV